MPRPRSLKLAFAASILLVVAHAAASSHAHDGEHEHADEVCLVCVASADLAPAALVPDQTSGLTLEQAESEGQTAAPFLARHAAYSARAPPSS